MQFLKSTLSHLKKHWFKYISITLSVVFIISFTITIKNTKKTNTMTYIQKDIDTLKALQYENSTKELLEYQLTTIYDYYNKLGYNLSEDKYIKTRQQILAGIQDTYLSVDLLENYLKINNIENKNYNILLENFEKTKTGKEHYQTYIAYKETLLKEVYYHIINSGLVDIEKEKEIIKDKYKITDEAVVEELVFSSIQDKLINIIVDTITKSQTN